MICLRLGGKSISSRFSHSKVSWIVSTGRISQAFSRKSPRVEDIDAPGVGWWVGENGVGVERELLSTSGCVEDLFWARLCVVSFIPHYYPDLETEAQRDDL